MTLFVLDETGRHSHMSEAEKKQRFAGVFDHTQKKFWGGPWYPYWSLILVSVLGGFMGLDHLYLRSPTTAILKCIVNIFGFGIWYFYDLLQVFGEKETVLNYGLTSPVLGPLGIAAGMFMDNQKDQTPSKSPLRYMVYMFSVFMPFGFDYVIAGDMNGAFAKFLSFLIIPLGIIWMIISILSAFFSPRSLFEKGMYRMFPFSFFMDPYGPNEMGPISLPVPDPNATPSKGIFDYIRSAFNSFIGFLLYPFKYLLSLLPGFNTIIKPLSSAATAAAASVGTTVAQGTVLAGKAMEGIEYSGASSDELSGQLKSASTPAGMVAAAQTISPAIAASSGLITNPLLPPPIPTFTQTGGGLVLTDTFDISNIALFSLFVFLLGSGAYFAMQRLNNTNVSFKKKEDENNRRKRDDTPPKP